jgi:hypothetical protein
MSRLAVLCNMTTLNWLCLDDGILLGQYLSILTVTNRPSHQSTTKGACHHHELENAPSILGGARCQRAFLRTLSSTK